MQQAHNKGEIFHSTAAMALLLELCLNQIQDLPFPHPGRRNLFLILQPLQWGHGQGFRHNHPLLEESRAGLDSLKQKHHPAPPNFHCQAQVQNP